MSRRKQTNPNKVHWDQVFAGLEEQARQAMMKTDFPGDLGSQRQAIQQLRDQDSSSSDSEGDEEETTQDEVSSHTSEEDGGVVKVEKDLENAEQPVGGNKLVEHEVTENLNSDPLLELCQCPLCQLDCGSREQLIAHVYQHTAAVVSAKSYMCPVCGRALSSPGSLGRHLLIHSEDQRSNCAVCGARFTSHATFNSEKLPEVLNMESLPPVHSEGPSSAEGKDTAFSPPVYPAGILLVCNNCAAYRKLLEAQTPSVRKWALRRQNEPLEVRLQRLERERTAKKSRRDNETPEEREVRRMRDREAKRLQRMQETDEQRARRLQRDREAMRLKRANETPEKRQARLIREREAKRLKRRLEKMDIMLRAQFGQDPSAMAALAAEMNFFQLPVSGVELDSQLLGKMAFEEQNSSSLH
ncbi:PREDICTED: zinc finger protein 821 isoform X1 [Chinchilla lanigera]|uniref:Zinc finger protein 821 n=2 Tax=Chinchilla lanigera TaxID=34839 RepID=A0A8C2UYK8_CHILA|nr:PREDICTED: zinc finger protein 821 isoform X1 [Chinchilla lanigera]XP_013359446.1 PREDICTED: zinc finger protein 821 isoform X1 [Chinchilla lanigera]XP_013359447.1 PREDICTED: zinc finger protein 821 isoform X1 [Chinchilla lanigera]XP_013359448.1 PREDICTED: zinc finger protein 821 isoform X1 [Chinchilla lanigera]